MREPSEGVSLLENDSRRSAELRTAVTAQGQCSPPPGRTPLEKTLPARETADWGHARTSRAVLMAPSAEWIQSAYSAAFVIQGKRLIAPNRDYPYEGLSAHHAGENWRYLDCVALALRRADGTWLELDPDPSGRGVRLTPWSTTYRYTAYLEGREGSSFPLEVTYYLASESDPGLATACVWIRSPEAPSAAGDLTLVVQPFLDIRHMYAGSDFEGHEVRPAPAAEGGHTVHVSQGRRRVVCHLPPGRLQLHDSPERLPWTYKLGTGTRREVPGRPPGRTETSFIPEEREVAGFFQLELPCPRGEDPIQILIECGLDSDEEPRPGEPDVRIRTSLAADEALLAELVELFPECEGHELGEGFLARVVGFTKFKTFIQPAEDDRPVAVPHAGAWWFRTPWYRDVFEGLLQSLRTVVRIPAERANLRRVLETALRSRHLETGLVPSRLPEFAHETPLFNSTDATLLCFLTATAYVEATGDLELAETLVPAVVETVERFRRAGASATPSVDGPPRLDSARALLLSVPQHSWIDTRGRSVAYAGSSLEDLPGRVSSRFVKDLYDRLGSKAAVEEALASPRFFLPEINAQWIAVLQGMETVAELLEGAGRRSAAEKASTGLEGLLERARSHFKEVFWNAFDGFLYNLVEERLELADPLECESTVTAAALLGESVFTRDELESLWRRTERVLLVRRRLGGYGSGSGAFGVLCKAEDQRIYYGDAQYHADVAWPRSTPYLVRLLGLLGRWETVREVLRTNLDHQMNESAVFYNQELFSRPCGNNPAPDPERCRDPVPVKNPVQFWSQWCDPYLDLLERDLGGAHGR